jgi:hypothetical protein
MVMTLLCFHFVKTYGQRLTAKLNLSFLSCPRIATLGNILRFHFFVCSLALIWFTKRAAGLAYVSFPEGPLPNYNEWVLSRVFAGKTRELASYFAGVAALFLYYSAAYLLLRHPPRVLSERFFVLAGKTRKRFLGYAFTVATANLLVARLDRVIEAPALQVALWLCIFLLPFYLHIGGTLRRRPAEGV